MRVSFERLARALVWLVLAVAAFLQPVANDTWWQLRAGRQIWHDHAVPLTEEWSWTAHGHPWPNHEWLWEALTGPLYAASPLLLGAVAGLLALAPLWVLRPRDPSLTSTAVLAALALPLCLAWSMRPQLIGLVCLALLLALLRRRAWWAVPPLMLVWANVHASVAVGGALLVLATLESLVRRRSEGRPLALVTLAAAAATLVQPLGVRLWSYVLEVPGRSRTTGIQEWAPAWEVTRAGVLVWILVPVVVLVMVLRRERLSGWEARVPATAVILLVPLAITGVRNGSALALAALPLLTTLLRPVQPRERGDVPAGAPLLVAATAAGVLLVGLVWSRPEVQGWRPVSPALVAAVDGCPGRLFNSYGAGGPLLFWTRAEVFVDSRQDPYPSAVLEEAVGVGEGRTGRLDGRVRCAVVERGGAAERALLHDGAWSTRLRDARWTVLVRSGP